WGSRPRWRYIPVPGCWASPGCAPRTEAKRSARQHAPSHFDGSLLEEGCRTGESFARVPDPVDQREHRRRAEHECFLARFRRDLAGDHGAVIDARVRGPLEHLTDHLAVETADVEATLAREDQIGSVQRVAEVDGVGHDVEPGLEPSTDRGEPTGEPTGGAGAGKLADIGTGARAGFVG